MFKKKLFTLASTALVFSLAITACSSAPKEETSAGTTAPTKEAAATSDAKGASSAKDLKPYKLVMIFPSGVVPKDLQAVQDEMSKYLTEKINATIEIRPIDWGAWENKKNLMFASGEQFDLMFTASWYGLGQEVAKGQIIPLDDLIDKYGQGIKSVLDPAYVEGGKLNGKSYGVVANKEFAATKGVVMRKDLVDKYHIDLSAIKELKDLEPIYKTIKENEPNIVPLQVKNDRSPASAILGYGMFDMLGDGPGVLDRESNELKVIDMFETQKFMDTVKLMHKWYQAGYINKDGATNKDSEFLAVKAGKAFSYGESMKPGFDMQETRNTGMPMVTAELTKPYTTTGDTTSAMFAIPNTSKDPERAMMFLNLLYTDKTLLNMLDWGLEGKHYVKAGDNIIDYPQGVDAATVGYNLNLPWMFGNQLNSYIWKTEDPKIWDKYKEFNSSAQKSIALGFVFDPEKVKNEIAATNNVMTQFTGGLYTGTIDPEKYVPEFVSKMKAAGMDKIIAEKQRQLDEWAKANKK
ncbi:ABC transporter substrate-binding protein [Paenibacillus hexagrammi]|uniref:ABC transporter substrate-binding protein n=1 Tax=Paenibacillus hexagrammi TaxID=2908839 RepID=A0ABY3SML6_9BACL|nr:ABC transporter substrate-binding protein [Paenibacillus sp. YPD9-1]UJF34969.1 ABC transporter substrate-binding protein [Paenibacillus sp. YPD9-1]